MFGDVVSWVDVPVKHKVENLVFLTKSSFIHKEKRAASTSKHVIFLL